VGLAVLFEQINRAIYPDRGPQVIQPAQWSLLRYFARANRLNRTVGRVAKYFGITKGPASRAVTALERRALLTSIPNPDDGRSALYSLTQKGRETLQTDPIERLAEAIAELPKGDRAALQRALFSISDHLSRDRDSDMGADTQNG